MKLFLEIGKGFQSGKDVFDNEIIESFATDEIAKYCSEQLRNELPDLDISVVADAIEVIDGLNENDRLVSIHGNVYKNQQARGVQGFYRSFRKKNSEKCKAFSITVAKAFRDHTDLTYKGVYNETKCTNRALDSIVVTRPISCAVEIGIDETMRADLTNPTVQRNFGRAIARGIVRYANAIH